MLFAIEKMNMSDDEKQKMFIYSAIIMKNTKMRKRGTLKKRKKSGFFAHRAYRKRLWDI